MVKIGKAPPFWFLIKLAFPNSSLQNQIYAFYPNIYMAHGVWKDDIMPPDLLAHEETHLKQQGSFFGAMMWWLQYWLFGEFRYEMELQACIAQLKEARKVQPSKAKLDEFIVKLATNLSSEVYNKCVKFSRVESDLRHALLT